MERLPRLLLALVFASALPATAATIVRQGAGFHVQSDTSPLFSDFFVAASGQQRSVGWNVSHIRPQVDDAHIDSTTTFAIHTYAIPAITVTADAGYQLSGLTMKFRGTVFNRDVPEVTWDALLFGYRFQVDGTNRTLVSSLTPAPTPIPGTSQVVLWTLTERDKAPSVFSSFSFRADLELVLIANGDTFRRQALAFLDSTTDPVVEFDFRVDPIVFGTGVPTGGTAPVPEPAAWATLIAGLAGLAARCRSTVQRRIAIAHGRR